MKLIDEEKLKTVITTRFVLEHGSPVLSVYRDEDGDWQFLGAEECGEDDARVLSVAQMLSLDASLAGLPDMEPEQSAFRKNARASWALAE
jgi:hypothetical protein